MSMPTPTPYEQSLRLARAERLRRLGFAPPAAPQRPPTNPPAPVHAPCLPPATIATIAHRGKEIAAAVEPARPPEALRLTSAVICKVVADHYRLTLPQMRSMRRHAELVRARHVAMYLCDRLTDLSLSQIGRALGGRDYTTILYGIDRVKNLMAVDPSLAAEVEAIERRLVAWFPGARGE